jgi:hypothetical protein
MFTLRIYTNPDLSLHEDHTYESADDAVFAVNHLESKPNPEPIDSQWGFKIARPDGIVFHSSDGEGIGEAL